MGFPLDDLNDPNLHHSSMCFPNVLVDASLWLIPHTDHSNQTYVYYTI